jgi:hypothetical protein
MVAAPANAQAPRAEVSVGYNYLHIDTTDEDSDELANLPMGWYADVTGYLTSMFGVVGQITGNFKAIDSGEGFDVDTKIHTFMGGVRAGGGASNVRPFGQVLFGAANAKFSFLDFDESSTDAALQLGAGVNVMSGASACGWVPTTFVFFPKRKGPTCFASQWASFSAGNVHAS